MKQPRSQIPAKFIVRFGHLVRQAHGLPDSDYEATRPCALRAFQRLRRVSAEDVVKRRLQEDREGAWSLLFACMDFATFNGTPISLSDISDARPEDNEWERDGIKSVTWFLMNAVHSMKQPCCIPEIAVGARLYA